MADRFNPGRLGDWVVFCDICGKKCYASETVKLSNYTGRDGLRVCLQDADVQDPSLVPFRYKSEKPIPDVRVNHTNTSNAAPLIDTEDMAYQWYLASSQDGAIIMSSQDDAWIISETPIG